MECDYCKVKLESDEEGLHISFSEFEELTYPSIDDDITMKVNDNDNVFTAEWKGKADILSLRIKQFGKYPLKIYDSNQNYLKEACELFKNDKARHKM